LYWGITHLSLLRPPRLELGGRAGESGWTLLERQRQSHDPNPGRSSSVSKKKKEQKKVTKLSESYIGTKPSHVLPPIQQVIEEAITLYGVPLVNGSNDTTHGDKQWDRKVRLHWK
jgi:hypothetical protein